MLWQPKTHRHVKHFLRELDRPFHPGTATGEHDAGGNSLLKTAAAQFVAHQAKQFLVARLDDLRERLARQTAGGPFTDAGYLDALVWICQLRESARVAHLDVLGVLRRRAHRDRDIV